MKRKYWVGVSGIDSRKPEEFITFEVKESDDLANTIAETKEYIERDYNGDWEIEADEPDVDRRLS